MNDTIRLSKQRRWSESKAHSSWQIFKIMAEFVDGFEALAKIGPVFPYLVRHVPNPDMFIMNSH